MIEFRKATQEDMDFVRQDPFEDSVKGYPYMEIPADNCYAAIFDSEVVSVFGLVIKWEGVGLLWLMLTRNFRKKGLSGRMALRAIQDKINYLIETNNLWRAEATVRTDFPIAKKMIEFLGFKCEGVMEKYCPDKGDAFLYSKIIER